MARRARQSYFDAAGQEILSSVKAAGAEGPRQAGARSAEDSADALFESIDELFDEYEADAGDWRTETIEFSLSALLDDVVKMYGERAEAKGLKLSLEVSAAIPLLVRGDRERLRQILVNLLANSVKFAERGTITVRCSVAEETARRALIRFSIVDTGIEIDREQADHPIGHDFGLIASRRLIEQLGGRMETNGEFGRGSTISFSMVLNKTNRFDRSPLAGKPAMESSAEHGPQVTIHVESLLGRCFGDVDFCTLMLRKFSHRAGDQLAALDRATRSGNAIELARAAHTLKGLAGNLSAAPLQMFADRLEQVARRSKFEEAGLLVDQVRDQVARCMEEIPRIVAEISRSE